MDTPSSKTVKTQGDFLAEQLRGVLMQVCALLVEITRLQAMIAQLQAENALLKQQPEGLSERKGADKI